MSSSRMLSFELIDITDSGDVKIVESVVSGVGGRRPTGGSTVGYLNRSKDVVLDDCWTGLVKLESVD